MSVARGSISLTTCCVRVLAARIVRQSFGRMRMNERKWEAAYDEFYAAFKSYQEAGSQEARKCLKCVPHCPALLAVWPLTRTAVPLQVPGVGEHLVQVSHRPL